MAEAAQDIDLDSVIDRLLEGELYLVPLSCWAQHRNGRASARAGREASARLSDTPVTQARALCDFRSAFACPERWPAGSRPAVLWPE